MSNLTPVEQVLGLMAIIATMLIFAAMIYAAFLKRGDDR